MLHYIAPLSFLIALYSLLKIKGQNFRINVAKTIIIFNYRSNRACRSRQSSGAPISFKFESIRPAVREAWDRRASRERT